MMNSDIESNNNAMVTDDIPLTADNGSPPNGGKQQDNTGKTFPDADISITHTSDSMLDDDGDDDNVLQSSTATFKQSRKRRRKAVWAAVVVFSLLALALGLTLGLGAAERKQTASSDSSSVPEENAQEDEGESAVTTGAPVDEQEEGVEDQVVTTLAPQDDMAADKAPIRDEDSATEEGVMTGLGPQYFTEDDWEWPILVGMHGQMAADTLEFYYPGMYDIYILPEDAVVTMDYDVYRIRIFVNEETKLVARTPMIG